MPTLKYRDPADGLWKYLDGAAQGHPMAMIASSAIQTATTAVVTTAALDTVMFDTGGMTDGIWSLGSQRLIAPLSGYYRINGRASWTSNATGYRALVVRKNGTNANSGGTIIHDAYVMPASGNITVVGTASEPIWLSAGDYITMNILQTSGADLTSNIANGRWSSLALEYLGLVGAGATSGSNVTTLQATQDVIVAGESVPRGSVGYAEITPGATLTSATTTGVDITGCSVTFTAVAGRYYRMTGVVHARSSIANDRVIATIMEGAVQQQYNQGPQLVTINTNYTHEVKVVKSPTAGAHTFKLQFARLAGTGTVTVSAAATAPCFLLIEDIGT